MHEKKGNCVHGAQRLLDPQTLTEYLEQPPFFHKLSRCLRVSASRSSLRFLGYRYVSSPLIRPGSDSHFLQIVNVQMHSSTVLYFSSLQQHSCKIASPLKRAKEYREIVIRGSKKEKILQTLFVSFFRSEFRDNCQSLKLFNLLHSILSFPLKGQLQLFNINRTACLKMIKMFKQKLVTLQLKYYHIFFYKV